jgi:GDP-L-fucose synthase
MQSHLNVGSGSDITIAELANAIGSTVGYQGQIRFDPSKPDGAPRKFMNSVKLNQLGWAPKMDLISGLNLAYQSFLTLR